MGGGKKGGGKSSPPPQSSGPDWAAIMAAERAAQERQMAEMRAQAERQRQLEEQRRIEEENKRRQAEWDATQKLKDEKALGEYTEAKQAAAAQASGGGAQAPTTTRVTPETPAPGLEQTPPTRFRGANQAYAPSGVSVGGRIARFLGGA